ncbi:acyltransferase family protein [Radiobacillus kanasensis]|uniref:acyltransferase family protein n=1 Tax=Radiobacillus kanasensis TaxID=2844358 RepID=UPI001E4FF1EA|nr:acyltransferase family protein [Radiobacillus kanasensis]UFT99002.1 acyltransferase family protein [Radiobacillus kanasensis]
MQRNAYLDNAKVLLITLVVFGHVIQPFTSESTTVHVLYQWIYTFHMPLFIMLSGFFAKGSSKSGYLKKLAKKLIVPYLLFQMIYTVYYYSIGRENWVEPIFYPHWALWFLISLFCWHILLIFYKKLDGKMGLPIALALGIGIGYLDVFGHYFSLSRTFVFFPFFLIGYYLNQEHLSMLKRKGTKYASVLVLLTIALVIYLTPDFSTDWLLGSKSYSNLDAESIGGLARIGVYGVAVLMSFSVLAWIPNTSFRYTAIGQKTIYVYLLHGFFIQYFREADWFSVNHILDILGLAVISIAIVWLLSSGWIVASFQPVVEGTTSGIRTLFNERIRKRAARENGRELYEQK